MVWQIFIGHRSASFPLLSACRFVEFDTSVICHEFMHCFGPFLFQAMFLSLQEFAFKEQNTKFTVNIWLTCIRYCEASPGVIRTVCKYTSRFLSRIYLSSYVFPRRRPSLTSRKLYVCLETI